MEDVEESNEDSPNQLGIKKEESLKSPSNAIRAAFDKAKEETDKEKKLEQLMRNDPSGAYQDIEADLVYNYGRTSGVAKDPLEILHHK